MEESIHHSSPVPRKLTNFGVPAPNPAPAKWRETFARSFGEDDAARWGRRFVKTASDMLVVCNEDLKILFHNRGFLRGIGHQHGSYVGASLYDFFPAGDRVDAEYAFGQLMSGRSAGIRLQATLVTLRGRRKIDARVTRARRSQTSFSLYFVIRDETERIAEMAALEKRTMDPILGGLPVAAFRTDNQLRITHAFGSLWEEMGFQPEILVGADLSNSDCHLGPRFLHDIDFCDTMAGLTLHSAAIWKEESVEITVEPFVDELRKGKVIGTLGLMRKAKKLPAPRESVTRDLPDPGGPTRRVLLAREADPFSPVSEEDIVRIRSGIRPRPMSPLNPSCRDGEKLDESEDAVALAN